MAWVWMFLSWYATEGGSGYVASSVVERRKADEVRRLQLGEEKKNQGVRKRGNTGSFSTDKGVLAL